MARPIQGQDETAEEEAPSSLPSRFAAGMARLGGALSALLILVVLALVTYAVVQRYVLEQPLDWSDAMAGYLSAALIVGAAEALRRGDHISIDLLASRFKPRGRRIIAAMSDLAVLILALVLCWSTWGQIRFAYDFGSYTADHLEIASWIPIVPVLLAFALLALMALARFVDTVARGAGR